MSAPMNRSHTRQQERYPQNTLPPSLAIVHSPSPSPVPSVRPSRFQDITFIIPDRPRGAGIPLDWFLPPPPPPPAPAPGQPVMPASSNNPQGGQVEGADNQLRLRALQRQCVALGHRFTLVGGSDLIFASSPNPSAIILQIVCPPYEKVLDNDSIVQIDGRGLTRAGLGTCIAKLCQKFLDIKMNKRFTNEFVTQNHANAGPFRETIDQYNLIALRWQYEEFWKVEVVRNVL